MGRYSVMAPDIRRFLASLSACGIATSLIAYIESFSATRVDSTFRWSIILIPGWMALFIPIYALEYPASRAPSFSWKGFARGMPSWVVLCSRLLFLIAIGHLAWFAVHSGWGVPTIRDGQYVLIARGRVLKILTEAEYLKLAAAGARTFAAMMIAFYFVPMVYWWFRRKPAEA